MAYKPLLNTTKIMVVREIIKALSFFDLNPKEKYQISGKNFTKRKLLKELKKQKIKPKDLPRILEYLSSKEEFSQTKSDPKEETPQPNQAKQQPQNLTTNIDQRDLSEFRQNQIEQVDAILKKSTIASIQAKKAFGNKVSTSVSKQIDALSWKLVANNPQINPNTLAHTLLAELQNTTVNLVPNEKTKTEKLQKTIQKNIQDSNPPTPQKIDPAAYSQKTSLWVSQVADEIKKDSPKLTKSQAVKAAHEIRQAIQATAMTTNPQTINPKDLSEHLSKSLLSASQATSKTTGSKQASTKTPVSSAVVKNIDSQLLKIGLVEESQQIVDQINPQILPQENLNFSDTSTILHKLHTYTQKPERFNDFIQQTNQRYAFLQRSSLVPKNIRTTRTFFRKIFSQILGRGASTSDSHQIVSVIKNLPLSSSPKSFISTPSKNISLPPGLTGPMRGLGSSLKKLAKNGVSGLGNLLKKGGLKAASGASKIITTIVSSEVWLPVLATVAIAIVLVVGYLIIMEYTHQTANIFPNVTSTQMGGSGNPGVYGCDPTKEECPEPECIGDMCDWPVQCGCIISGPYGGTHSENKLNAIDIMTTNNAGCSGYQGVYATYPGKVTYIHSGMFVGEEGGPGNYGNRVEITTDEGFILLYGHLIDIQVKLDQKIKVGDLIGSADTTGMGDEHLHFEIRHTNKSIRDVLPSEASIISDYCVSYESCGGGKAVCIQNIQ